MSGAITWETVLAGLPLVAVLRGVRASEAPEIAAVLFEAGWRCVEITLNSPDPFASIAAVHARFDGAMLIGAGTVLTAADVAAAADAGARLIVSPDTNPAVVGAAKALDLTSLPGVFTPTEALAALALGADALKLFPAEAASPAALRAIKAVLPAGTRVLPVGGIDPSAMAVWRAAGAAGFGIGGALYRAGDTPDIVRGRARSFAATWRSEG